jgi:hypothetical protein
VNYFTGFMMHALLPSTPWRRFLAGILSYTQLSLDCFLKSALFFSVSTACSNDLFSCLGSEGLSCDDFLLDWIFPSCLRNNY